MNLIIPKNYDPKLNVRQTQQAIKYIRDTFQKELEREMGLERISAPLFVEKNSGFIFDSRVMIDKEIVSILWSV